MLFGIGRYDVVVVMGVSCFACWKLIQEEMQGYRNVLFLLLWGIVGLRDKMEIVHVT
jgi:hypothetical protein